MAFRERNCCNRRCEIPQEPACPMSPGSCVLEPELHNARRSEPAGCSRYLRKVSRFKFFDETARQDEGPDGCKRETKVVPRENSLSSFEDEGLFLFSRRRCGINALLFRAAKTFWDGKTD